MNNLQSMKVLDVILLFYVRAQARSGRESDRLFQITKKFEKKVFIYISLIDLALLFLLIKKLFCINIKIICQKNKVFFLATLL